MTTQSTTDTRRTGNSGDPLKRDERQPAGSGGDPPTRSDTSGRFVTGSAPRDAVRGWFVGQFLNGAGLRRTEDVEIKWGAHAKGDKRAKGWSMTGSSTTYSVLLQGRFIVRFRVDGEVHQVVLEKPGDYVVYGPGTPHTWEAPEACTVLSVRAPSVPDDEHTFPD